MPTDPRTNNPRPQHAWRTVVACLGAAAAVGAIAVSAAVGTGESQDQRQAAASDNPGPSPHPNPNPHPKDPNQSPDPDGDGHSHEPVTYSPVRGHHAWGNKGGPGLSPQEVEKRVVNGLRAPGRVKAVKVTPGPDASAITVRLDHYDDSLPELWNAELAAGAAAQLSATTETSYNEVVSSASMTGLNDKGVETTVDLGTSPIALNQAFDSPSDADLTSHVHEVAKQFGLTVSAVQILHPLDSALSVTFTVPDDAKIDWTMDQLSTALVGSAPNVEGVLMQLNSTKGTPLLQEGAAFRTGAGSLWFAPGQDGRFGAAHGHLPIGLE